MSVYKFNVTKTYHYYGYPQAQYNFKFEGEFLNGTVTWYGCNGFDVPKISPKLSGLRNGYFWSMRVLMTDIFCGRKFRKAFALKEGETMKIEIDDGKKEIL